MVPGIVQSPRELLREQSLYGVYSAVYCTGRNVQYGIVLYCTYSTVCTVLYVQYCMYSTLLVYTMLVCMYIVQYGTVLYNIVLYSKE